jgi:hypothetical protein
MGKDTTRLSTDRENTSGPQERILGDHALEAIEAGVLTPEGSLALDGGHLAGNKDQLHAGSKTHGPASPVPGATGLMIEVDDTATMPEVDSEPDDEETPL